MSLYMYMYTEILNMEKNASHAYGSLGWDGEEQGRRPAGYVWVAARIACTHLINPLLQVLAPALDVFAGKKLFQTKKKKTGKTLVEADTCYSTPGLLP